MQGFELLEGLAEIESDLAKRVQEARRSAEEKIGKAEQERDRILAATVAQIAEMEEDSRSRIARDSARLAEEARKRAEEEAGWIRERAAPVIDRAVEFILSKVMP